MGNKIKLSPVIIIVILVVVVAIVALVASTLSGTDGVINHLENKKDEAILPTIEATLSSEEPEQDKVIITVVASIEDEDGIESIVLPDGTNVNGSSKDYTVTENGTYEFSAIAKNGEQKTIKVDVNNIRTISAEHPYIPDGFEYIGGEVDTGYVIQDSVGNQFVWIPVPTGILTRNTMLNSDYEESNSSSELVNSVAKYYGFYIARFEASSYEVSSKKVATSLPGRIPWTNVTFTEANQAANDMAEAFGYEEGIKTALVNSYALDTTLDWINESVENYSSNISYGNYSGTILPTGQTESDIVNNICDLAGNVREWTTEIDKSVTISGNKTSSKDTTTDENSVTKRIVRGGSANLSRTASARTGNSENLSDGYWGFRVILYK